MKRGWLRITHDTQLPSFPRILTGPVWGISSLFAILYQSCFRKKKKKEKEMKKNNVSSTVLSSFDSWSTVPLLMS